ncbi:MAG: hypothetical protein ACP5GZ_12080 [Vulcanisaeta sp.]|uniref:hypothetical protein n=1 Tax=Vulcanisaeta sp. TaxID=2020871 RepID=UPI003D142EF7
MLDVIAASAICMKLRTTERLKPRALALLTYANASITNHLVDAMDSMSTATLGQRPVIGGLGPMDGSVIGLALLRLMVYATAALMRKTPKPKP